MSQDFERQILVEVIWQNETDTEIILHSAGDVGSHVIPDLTWILKSTKLTINMEKKFQLYLWVIISVRGEVSEGDLPVKSWPIKLDQTVRKQDSVSEKEKKDN